MVHGAWHYQTLGIWEAESVYPGNRCRYPDELGAQLLESGSMRVVLRMRQ